MILSENFEKLGWKDFQYLKAAWFWLPIPKQLLKNKLKQPPKEPEPPEQPLKKPSKHLPK